MEGGGGGGGAAAIARRAASFPRVRIGFLAAPITGRELADPTTPPRGIGFFFGEVVVVVVESDSSRSQLSVASMSIGNRNEEFLLAAPRRNELPPPPPRRPPRAGFGRPPEVAASRAARGSALKWDGFGCVPVSNSSAIGKSSLLVSNEPVS